MFELIGDIVFKVLIHSMPLEEKHIYDAWEQLALSR